MTIQGNCDIQGTRKCGGGSAGPGAPEALTWNNLSDLMTVGAPTRDLQAQYINASSDPTGTFVEANDAIALANFTDIIQWNQGAAPGFFPGWNPATTAIRIRGTILQRPTNLASRMFQGFYMFDTFFLFIGFRAGVYCYSNLVGGNGDSVFDGQAPPEGAANLCDAIPEPYRIRMAMSTGEAGQFIYPNFILPTNAGVVASNSLGFWAVTGTQPDFVFGAGCRAAAATGGQEMKILWEYAYSDFTT